MFWIALAAQLSVPFAVDPRMVFSFHDIPDYALEDGRNRFIVARTTIRPDGRSQDCAAERSGGDPRLDALTCAIILKRAKFLPPKGADGAPSYAIVRTPVSWTIGGPPSKRELLEAYPPDVQLSVNTLPKGAHSPTIVQLLVAVDESGHVTGCNEEAFEQSSSPAKRYPELVQIACGTVTTEFVAAPAKDDSGQAVPSIQPVSVSFSATGTSDHRP